MKSVIPILLVEDDQVDAMLVTRAFQELQLSHPITVASDGEEAWQLLRSPKESSIPKLILLDLNMPRMNGVEFLQKVKNDEKLRKIPIIVLTSSREEEDVATCFSLGAAGYIPKPVTYERLLKILETVHLYWSVNELPRAN